MTYYEESIAEYSRKLTCTAEDVVHVIALGLSKEYGRELAPPYLAGTHYARAAYRALQDAGFQVVKA